MEPSEDFFSEFCKTAVVRRATGGRTLGNWHRKFQLQGLQSSGKQKADDTFPPGVCKKICIAHPPQRLCENAPLRHTERLVSMTTGATDFAWTAEKRGTVKEIFKHLFVGTFGLCGM